MKQIRWVFDEPDREKTCLGFSTRSGTNRAVRPHKIARDLKFLIREEEGLYCLCSENKGVDQLHGYQLIWAFVFANAKSRFSHDTALMNLPGPEIRKPFSCSTQQDVCFAHEYLIVGILNLMSMINGWL